MRIEEFLKSKVGNCIDFSNAILINKKTIRVKPIVYYSLSKYKKMGSYDIQTDIREHVTLVKLMYSLRNLNHSISVVG